MEKFKVGDVVKKNKQPKIIFEVQMIYPSPLEEGEEEGEGESDNGPIVLRGGYTFFGYFEIDASEAVHATKNEKIKFYEDKIKAQQGKIKTDQAKLEEAKAIVEEPVWPLLQNTEHWLYTVDGKIVKYERGFVNNHCNQALSEKRAKQLYEKARLMQDMYLWVDTFCPDWEPDWSDGRKGKWGISTCQNNSFVDLYSCSNYLVFGISVPSSRLAEKMLAEFEDRIEAWY